MPEEHGANTGDLNASDHGRGTESTPHTTPAPVTGITASDPATEIDQLTARARTETERRQRIQEMTAEVSNTVGQFATKAVSELESRRQAGLPVLAPDPANHEAFDTALADTAHVVAEELIALTSDVDTLRLTAGLRPDSVTADVSVQFRGQQSWLASTLAFCTRLKLCVDVEPQPANSSPATRSPATRRPRLLLDVIVNP